MVNRLTAEDLSFLYAYERLVKYVIEAREGEPCARLREYMKYAQLVLGYSRGVDRIKPQGPKLINDYVVREELIADLIRRDGHLLGMLRPQGLVEEKQRICVIYARMVIGHEYEQDIRAVLGDLQSSGVFDRVEMPDCG